MERSSSVRISKKILSNWRQACDKTRDRTRELIKKWRTLPETGSDAEAKDADADSKSEERPYSWSVHVWATWVQRGSCDEEESNHEPDHRVGRHFLSDFQKAKFTHFFRHVLDMNHDNVISAEDFDALNERIRHYADWTPDSVEFNILKEVHSGFLECFLTRLPGGGSRRSSEEGASSDCSARSYVNLEEWLDSWGHLVQKSRCLEDFPLWLQYFPRIFFRIANRNGSGVVSKEELGLFYTSFMGFDPTVVKDGLDEVYNGMTSNGDTKLTYHVYKLCFANFLLGRAPHGPGQFIFGVCLPHTLTCSFPIDYSALNAAPEDLEKYDPDNKQSNRRSVIV